jgi:hypothetical protein
MPVSDFWGATINRSVPGQITLTITDASRPEREPVSITQPWDGTKATKSDLRAAWFLIEEALGKWNIPSGDIWDYRCQYARMTFKAMDYADVIAGLPGNQRAPWTAKRNRIITFRDEYRALAGE